MPLPPLDSSAPVILIGMSDERTLWFVRLDELERVDVGGDADKPDAAADEIAQRVKVVRRIYQDAAGRLYLLAEEISEKESSKPRPGLRLSWAERSTRIRFIRRKRKS